LVQNFAAQAVIAIENTRLLNELRESLDRQTATSEVLSVISSSPGELEPVFEAMLANAMRICEANFGHLLLYDGESYRAAHLHNLPAAYHKIFEQGPIRPNQNLLLVGSRIPSKPFKSLISRLSPVTMIHCASPVSNLGEPERYSPSRCSRKISSLAQSLSTV